MKTDKKDLPLDQFIEFALYDKVNGYYMKKNPFGKEGDFITAPNITRLFSEIIAIWVLTFWKSIGSPRKFNLLELGAGNGEMMKVIIETLKNFPEKVVRKRYKKAVVIKNVNGECSTFEAILVCLIISTSPVTDINEVSLSVICHTLPIPGRACRII